MNYKFIDLLYTLFIIMISYYYIIMVKQYNLLYTKTFVFQSYLGINASCHYCN